MNDAGAIQIKLSDGSAAYGGETDETQVVRTPGKMLVPGILAWVKERRLLARGGIKRVRFIVLGTITTLTGQSQVVCGACATSTFRNDMFDGVQLGRAKFWAEAIFAVSQRAVSDQSSQFGWDPLLSHGAQV